MKRPVQVFSYSITNKSVGSVDIHIDGEIVDASTQAMIEAFFGDTTTVSYKSFRNSINEIDSPVYNVIINSPGGHVGDAMAIFDLLTEMQNKGKVVNTIGRGIVASSATLILLAGKKPEMSANSWFMIHTVGGGISGTVDQVESYAATMRKFNDKVVDIYSTKSGKTKDEINAMMVKETWLTAQEASSMNLVSTVSGDQTFTNLIKPENWDYANTVVLNKYNGSVNINTNNEDMKKFFTDLMLEIKNSIAGIKPVAGDDNTVLVSSIAEAVSKPFGTIGEAVENHVNTAIEAATAPLTTSITALTGKVTALEAENVELKAQLLNVSGGKQNAPLTGKEVTPIGAFN